MPRFVHTFPSLTLPTGEVLVVSVVIELLEPRVPPGSAFDVVASNLLTAMQGMQSSGTGAMRFGYYAGPEGSATPAFIPSSMLPTGAQTASSMDTIALGATRAAAPGTPPECVRTPQPKSLPSSSRSRTEGSPSGRGAAASEDSHGRRGHNPENVRSGRDERSRSRPRPCSPSPVDDIHSPSPRGAFDENRGMGMPDESWCRRR